MSNTSRMLLGLNLDDGGSAAGPAPHSRPTAHQSYVSKRPSRSIGLCASIPARCCAFPANIRRLGGLRQPRSPSRTPMNFAKSMLTAILALPVAELVVFVLVTAAIGFGPAVLLILVSSLLGGLVLRHAGGRHIERIRVAMGS